MGRPALQFFLGQAYDLDLNPLAIDCEHRLRGLFAPQVYFERRRFSPVVLTLGPIPLHRVFTNTSFGVFELDPDLLTVDLCFVLDNLELGAER